LQLNSGFLTIAVGGVASYGVAVATEGLEGPEPQQGFCLRL